MKNGGQVVRYSERKSL